MATLTTNLAHETEFIIAKAEDYAGVMAIEKDMYAGVDYLPEKYMEYINDPHRFCYVGKIGNDIVAFGINLIADEGKDVKDKGTNSSTVALK